MRVRWRHVAIVPAILVIAFLTVLVVTPAIGRRLAFGTFSTKGPPPRIDYCGRRYYPDSNFPNAAYEFESAVAAALSGGIGADSRAGSNPDPSR